MRKEREGEKERCVPGSEHSWWHGSRPASILPHQGSAHPGWMKRLADVIGNILHRKQEIHFEPVFLPFISLICSVFCSSAPQSAFYRGEKNRFIQKTCYIFGAVAQNYPKLKAENCKHCQFSLFLQYGATAAQSTHSTNKDMWDSYSMNTLNIHNKNAAFSSDTF